MGFPKFPAYGEPWLDCPICGESFPRHMMRRHYKKGFLVDNLCADDRTHDDYMAELTRGRERPDPSEQVVAGQGPSLTPSPPTPPVPSTPPSGPSGGAGGSGAGGGGAGG